MKGAIFGHGWVSVYFRAIWLLSSIQCLVLTLALRILVQKAYSTFEDACTTLASITYKSDPSSLP